MAERKTERLMNLIFALLSTRQYLSKDQIREAIADYRESTVPAFERKFERDKAELRDLGIEIEMGSHDVLGDDPGYRIVRETVELPDLSFTREESTVIAIAAQMWDHAGMSGSSAMALAKLKAIGVTVDSSSAQLNEPKLATNEPTFDAVWEATQRRIEIGFTYRAPGTVAAERRLQPWKMLQWRDRWYVCGQDLDREAPRMFRLSRMIGDVEDLSRPGAFEVPADADVSHLVASLLPAAPDEDAELLVRAGRAQALRRRATSVSASSREDFETVRVPYATTEDFASRIASYGPDVLVVGPETLRDAVRRHLEAVLEAAG